MRHGRLTLRPLLRLQEGELMTAKYSQASKRLMRQATAYARLAARAHRNGQSHDERRYWEHYLRLRDSAQRLRERETK